jgi:hypothetical protein
MTKSIKIIASYLSLLNGTEILYPIFLTLLSFSIIVLIVLIIIENIVQ